MDGVPASVAPMLAVEGPLPVDGGWAYETKWDLCTRFRPVGRLKWRSTDLAVFHAVKESLTDDFSDEGVRNVLELDETANLLVAEMHGGAHT